MIDGQHHRGFVINWEEIWKIHAPHFKNGFSHVPLGKGLSFLLKPGPGFGDLSHPTTNLVLNFMKPIVQGKIVVDIGCGTGVLSIAAALLGAKAVYAFEIDPDAIKHAKENFELNKLKIFLNKTPPHLDLVTLNMISSEQKIALSQYPFIKKFPHILLSSGLLQEEREGYLQEMSEWRLLQESQKKSWIGFKLIMY